MIFLIGFMGAGKTTLGKQLAEELGWRFLDLDHEIERAEGRPIAELFAQHGESWFRQRERRALEALVQEVQTPSVVACGGGTPCFLNNMQWMNAHGTTFYLRLPVSALVGRLLPEQAHRPMISGVAPENLATHIETLLEVREPYYLEATYTLNPEQQTIEALAEIVAEL